MTVNQIDLAGIGSGERVFILRIGEDGANEQVISAIAVDITGGGHAAGLQAGFGNTAAHMIAALFNTRDISDADLKKIDDIIANRRKGEG